MNCETDFVAKDAGFLGLAKRSGRISQQHARHHYRSITKHNVEEKRAALVAKIGENMNIRRVAYLEGQVIASILTRCKNRCISGR